MGTGRLRELRGEAEPNGSGLAVEDDEPGLGAIFFLASGVLVAARCAQLAAPSSRGLLADGEERRLRPRDRGGLAVAWITTIAFTTTPICSDCSSGLACTRSTEQSLPRSRIATTRSWRQPGEPVPPIWRRRFDIDLRDPGFWRSSLAVIRDDIDRLEELTAG